MSASTSTGSPLDVEQARNLRTIPYKEIGLDRDTGFIGQGSYGTVYKATWRNKNVAIKMFEGDQKKNALGQELNSLYQVRHDNIVRLYGVNRDHSPPYLVMELANYGSLSKLLHTDERTHYDLRHACSWALQTARALAYLHGIKPKPITHRDLKPANLLLFNRRKEVKICDFGTACAVKTNMTNNTGSILYMAPEVFRGHNYHESCDVYSWAVTFWELLTRSRPFKDIPTECTIIWAVTTSNRRPKYIMECPKIIEDLICRCWDAVPANRHTMDEVVREMEFIFKLANSNNPDTNVSIISDSSPSSFGSISSTVSNIGDSPNFKGTNDSNLGNSFDNIKNETKLREKLVVSREKRIKTVKIAERMEELTNEPQDTPRSKREYFDEYTRLKEFASIMKKEYTSIQESLDVN